MNITMEDLTDNFIMYVKNYWNSYYEKTKRLEKNKRIHDKLFKEMQEFSESNYR